MPVILKRVKLSMIMAALQIWAAPTYAVDECHRLFPETINLKELLSSKLNHGVRFEMDTTKRLKLLPGKKRASISLSLVTKGSLKENSKNYAPFFLGKFHKMLNQVNAQLPNEVLTPLNVRLLLRDESGASQLKWIDQFTVEIELAIPAAFEKLDKEIFTRHLIATALHEYGHALIEQTLSANSELFKKNFIISKTQPFPPTAEQKKASVDTLFVKGLEEMFADLVAVLFTDNLNAVYDAAIAANESVEDSKIRSFSVAHHIKGWDYLGSYGLLAPVRSYLGQVITNKKMSAEAKGQMISSVLAVMLNAVDVERAFLIRSYNPAQEIWELELTPEQVNRRIISVMKELKISP